MKRITTTLGLVLVLLNSCGNTSATKWIQVPEDKLSIYFSVPNTAEVNITPSSSPAFEEGKRAAIYSVSDKEFEEKYRTPEGERFFDFYMFEPVSIARPFQDWLKDSCKSGVNLQDSSEEKDRGFWAYEFRTQCYPDQQYAIVKDDTVYVIKASPDNRDSAAIWSTIKNASFTPPEK